MMQFIFLNDKKYQINLILVTINNALQNVILCMLYLKYYEQSLIGYLFFIINFIKEIIKWIFNEKFIR